MAELTKELPNQDGIFQAPPRPGGSGVGIALGALAQGLEFFGNEWQERSAQRRQQAKADKEALKDEVYGNTFLAAARSNNGQDPFSDLAPIPQDLNITAEIAPTTQAVFTDTQADTPEVAAIKAEATSSAAKVKNIDTAINQGRMPPISRTANVDKIVLAMLNKYGPSYGKEIGQALRDAGLENSLFDETKAEQAMIDSQRAAVNDATQEAYKAGAANLTAAEIATMTAEEITSFGFNMQQSENEFQRTFKRAELSGMLATQQRENLQFEEKQTDKQIQQSAIGTAISQMAPKINAFLNALDLVGKPGTSPQLEEEVKNIETALTTQWATISSNILSQLGVTAGSEQYAAAKQQLDDYFNTNVKNVVTTRAQGLKAVNDIVKERLGLNVQVTLPLVSALNTVGVTPEVFSTLLNQYLASGRNAERLSSELKGLANIDFSQSSAQIELAEMLSLLNGNKTLEDFNPEKRTEYLRNMNGVSLNMAPKIARGDLTEADPYMNAYATAITASRSLTANSGRQANLNAALALTGNGRSRQALMTLANNAEFGAEAKTLIGGSRAASAQVYQNMIRLNRTNVDNYWVAAYNKNTGKWFGFFDEAAFRKANPPQPSSVTARFGNLPTPQKPPQPQSIKAAVGASNSLLDHLTETTQFDQRELKGTNMELRDFYTNGVPTGSMTKAAKDSQVTESQRLQQLQKFRGELESGRIDLSAPVQAPESVADVIIGAESGGDPNARNPASTATGAGQFIESTWIDVLTRNRPDLVEGKSRQEILALRTNPQISRAMVNAYGAENGMRLQEAGIEPNITNTYIAHFAGPDGAIALLNAPANTPVEDILTAGAIEANKKLLKGKTAAEVIAALSKKVSG